MERVEAALVALGGLAAIVGNGWFARAGVDSGRRYFGRPIPDGSREHRLTLRFGSLITVAVGTALLIAGTVAVVRG